MFVVVCCKMQGVPKGGYFKKKKGGREEESRGGGEDFHWLTMYVVLNQENMIYGDLIMSEKEYS